MNTIAAVLALSCLLPGADDMFLIGRARQFKPVKIDSPSGLRWTTLESWAMCQTEPRDFELSRGGVRFSGRTVTSQLADTTRPTSTAHGLLWNGEPQDGGKSYVVEQIGMLYNSGPNPRSTLLFTLSVRAIAKPTADGVFASCSGSQMSSKAVIAVNTSIVTSTTWYTTEPAVVVAGTEGTGTRYVPKGRIIIPPQHALGTFGLGSAGQASNLYTFIWSEIPADLQ